MSTDDPFDGPAPAVKGPAYTAGTETDPDRDSRWGRPAVLNPLTGKLQQFQRMTTLARLGGDEYNLTEWKLRMLAHGMTVGARDLIELASTLDPKDKTNSATFASEIVEPALDRAGANAGRRKGTALHDLTARADAGTPPEQLPEWARGHLSRYRAAMNRAGVTIVPNLTERFTIAPEVGAAGTMDRGLYRADWGAVRIGDVKSAKDLEYQLEEIEKQLAGYAHGLADFGVWHRDPMVLALPNPGVWTPLPSGMEVDLDTAVVMWLPSDNPDLCQLRQINIARGWRNLRRSALTREDRKAIKREGWTLLADPAPVTPGVPPTMPAATLAIDTRPEPVVYESGDVIDIVTATGNDVFVGFAMQSSVADAIDAALPVDGSPAVEPTGCTQTTSHRPHRGCTGIKGRRTQVQMDIDASRALEEMGQPVTGPAIDAAVAAGAAAREAEAVERMTWSPEEKAAYAAAVVEAELLPGDVVTGGSVNGGEYVITGDPIDSVPEQVTRSQVDPGRDAVLASLAAEQAARAERERETPAPAAVDPFFKTRAAINAANSRSELSAIWLTHTKDYGQQWTDELTQLGTRRMAAVGVA